MQEQGELISQSGEATEQTGTQEKPGWNFALRMGFRFAFSYIILYYKFGPLSVIPGVGYLATWYSNLFDKLVIWTGSHVLHLSEPIQIIVSGSGDKTQDYVENLLNLVFALIATLLWSLLDRKRKNYAYLHEWLRLYTCLTLGSILIGYGAAKVIKTQFPDLLLSQLLQPYGDSSPMGLLWKFMGQSTAYTVFTGVVEMVAGALLIIPRFTTLGALLSMGAMGNIFMLNMSYDVPVKLFSFNLLAMSVFLLAPEMQRLLNIFVLNRESRPLTPPPLFKRRYLIIGILVIQIVFLIYVSGERLYSTYQRYQRVDAPPPIYGIYTVDEFIVDGQVRPPLFTDESRWRRVIFDQRNVFSIVPAEGEMQRYGGKLDLAKKSIQLSRRLDKNWKSIFTIETPSPETIMLKGEMDGKKIQAKLRKLVIKPFLLTNRGFHWINELPYNR